MYSREADGPRPWCWGRELWRHHYTRPARVAFQLKVASAHAVEEVGRPGLHKRQFTSLKFENLLTMFLSRTIYYILSVSSCLLPEHGCPSLYFAAVGPLGPRASRRRCTRLKEGFEPR